MPDWVRAAAERSHLTIKHETAVDASWFTSVGNSVHFRSHLFARLICVEKKCLFLPRVVVADVPADIESVTVSSEEISHPQTSAGINGRVRRNPILMEPDLRCDIIPLVRRASRSARSR